MSWWSQLAAAAVCLEVQLAGRDWSQLALLECLLVWGRVRHQSQNKLVYDARGNGCPSAMC